MSDSKPWFTAESHQHDEKHAPATLRNRDAIVAVLKETLPGSGTVLEVASGTGEHAVYFGEHFTNLQFQPSDPDPECCRSISAWIAKAGATNVLPPLQLDALAERWPQRKGVDTSGDNPGIKSGDNAGDKLVAILCINMIHISPWEASIGLFQKAAKLLEPGDPLYLYGPYFRDDVETAQGNLDFERSLKSRNLQWGIRDVADMDGLAAQTGFARESLIEMPANNISLVYRR